MSLGSRRVMQIDILFNKSQKDLLHHLLVHMHKELEVSSRIKTDRFLELDQHSLKVVLQQEVMGLLHVLSVVGTTKECVFIESTSCLKCVHNGNFIEECPNNNRVMTMRVIEPCLLHWLCQAELHLEGYFRDRRRIKPSIYYHHTPRERELTRCCHWYY